MHGDESQSFTFSVVPSSDVADAYAFHEAIAGSDKHIWPRTRDQLEAYANNNFLFGARQTDTGRFVGLCYLKREKDDGPYELGGLTVAEPLRKAGIAGMLVRFALAHAIVYYDVWRNKHQVIAHVHESNDNPRHLLDRLGFEFVETKPYPGEGFPPSMKRNANGEVVGDIFRLTPDAARALANWFTNEFRGTLSSGARADLRFAVGTLDDMLKDLRDIARGLD